MGGRAGGAATAGVRVGRALALGDGEIVPAVQDGLLAEAGEALPVRGDPARRDIQEKSKQISLTAVYCANL